MRVIFETVTGASSIHLNFNAAGRFTMHIPEELEPKTPQRVMDLVRQAGVDVSDWANFAKGPNHATANPRYCYEWAFLEPGKLVVLNLWYERLEVVGDLVEQHLNLRKDALKEPNGPRASRRRKMLAAIETALADGLPVRVVVVKGRANAVDLRVLDPVPWAVQGIALDGHIVIRRGVPAAPYVDQFAAGLTDDGQAPGRRSVTGSVFERSPEIRRKVLLRALGICELCKQPGFKLRNGSIYLETHHVLPLYQHGLDNEDNVVALCPNDHREAHYGEKSTAIATALQAILAKRQNRAGGLA